MGAADPEAKDLLIGEMMSDYLEQAARDGICVSLSLVCLCVCLVRVSYECLRFVLCGRVGVCVFALAAQARVLACSCARVRVAAAAAAEACTKFACAL
jgi:hypothetical protein